MHIFTHSPYTQNNLNPQSNQGQKTISCCIPTYPSRISDISGMFTIPLSFLQTQNVRNTRKK